MKVLVATEKPFAPVAVEGIRKEVEGAGHELVLLEKYTDAAQLLDAVKDADALIVRSDKVTPAVLDAGKNLKVVVRAGAGYDNIDTAYAKEKGVVVENTPGQNSNAVAELVFGLLVYTVRNFYNGKAGTELKDKKLGILAFGNVGRNVARVAKGFGMDVYAYDAFCPKETIEQDGVTALSSAEKLYASPPHIFYPNILCVLSNTAAASALVVNSAGANVPSVLPCIIPFSDTHSTAVRA